MTPTEIEDALSGDRQAARALFDLLLPHIQRRVFAALQRRAHGGRVVRQEVLDLTQEVCVALFEKDFQALRRWEPGKGASLTTWVGRIAEHTVASIMRSGRRSPWSDTPTESASLEHAVGHSAPAEAAVASRETLAQVLEVLRAELSPLGYALFIELVVEERAVAEVCAARGLTPGAVYVWRNRLKKAARAAYSTILKDPAAPARTGG